MDFSHWMALESAMQGDQPRRSFSRATLRRIAGFARPHRRALLGFLVLSASSALLAVATPVLAGQVVDEIVDGGDETRVVWLALLIAAIALLDGAVGLAERWQSSKIGESLILDLRRAVFGHVQQMPVAFFTRTRTGALVSRLNNDVIGAQRAFTWTCETPRRGPETVLGWWRWRRVVTHRLTDRVVSSRGPVRPSPPAPARWGVLA